MCARQVSYEYVACQQERQGVMILSEFAGAAQSLNGSIVVNPWDSQEVADAIFEAVTMDAETRAENHRKLFKVRSSSPSSSPSPFSSHSSLFPSSSFLPVRGNENTDPRVLLLPPGPTPPPHST